VLGSGSTTGSEALINRPKRAPRLLQVWGSTANGRHPALPVDFSGVGCLFLAFTVRFRGLSPCSERTSAMKGENLPLGGHQIPRPKEDVRLGRVLVQPFVADLPMAEEMLDGVKGILDLAPDARVDRFRLTQQCAKLPLQQDCLQLSALHRHRPVGVQVVQLLALLDTRVTCIPIHGRVFALQQLGALLDIDHVRRSSDDGVLQSVLRIDANLRFRAKLLFFALLRLFHLRIARLPFAIHRRRCGRNRSVSNPTLGRHQSVSSQFRADLVEDRLLKALLFPRVAKLQERPPLAHRLSRQIDSQESPATPAGRRPQAPAPHLGERTIAGPVTPTASAAARPVFARVSFSGKPGRSPRAFSPKGQPIPCRGEKARASLLASWRQTQLQKS